MRDLCRIILFAAVLLTPTAISADVQKGLDAYDVGDYATSLAECQPAADSGDAKAQFCIGRLYANGFGVAMDDALALKWYGLAAEQGHAEALYNLGVMHANGWGVPMDDVAAAKWYRQAAELGSPMAQMSLANLCRNGRGVEQDVVEAFMWYAIAAELGVMTAGFKLDEIAPELSLDEKQLAEERAQAWLDANNGDKEYSAVMD